MTTLKDGMKMGDIQVQVELRCAQCNAPVKTGEKHTCNKEDQDGNTSNSTAN